MPPRHEYVRQLQSLPAPVALPPPPIDYARQPAQDDAEALADLMLAAYRGTIDYDGETITEARAEIERYFASTAAPARLNCSWVAWRAGQAISACLVCEWPERGCPLIAYVLTRPDWKGRRLAERLLRPSLESLAGAGASEVRAVITAGNLASERLFARLGFTRVSMDAAAW
jgi:RimJ/RimL family protein N-acetyltransferase